MKLSKSILSTLLSLALLLPYSGFAEAAEKRLAYIVSDQRIPFWDIMRRGISTRAAELGYKLATYSAENDARRELEFTVKAVRDKVDGIILSPTNSSAAATILKIAGTAGIPVVIADIGADRDDYLSYIASDNYAGSYELGKLLVKAMRERNWESGRVGIIAIPQKRANGKARTAGFMKALVEAGFKAADIRQQVDFSYRETFAFTRQMIAANPDLRALWLQGSDRYQAALDAITEEGKRDQILLICFDAEPEFIDMIADGRLVGAGMQQPFLMGEEAVNTMARHLAGGKVVKERKLPVLAVSNANLKSLLPVIRRNVLGQPAR